MKHIILILILCTLLCCGCGMNAEIEKEATSSLEQTTQEETADNLESKSEENETDEFGLESEEAKDDSESQSKSEEKMADDSEQKSEEATVGSDSQQKSEEKAADESEQESEKVTVASDSQQKSEEAKTGSDSQPTSEAKAADGSALSVSGTQLQDAQNTPVQLRGISTHGLAWYPDYINEECFRQFKDEWGMNAVRLAMYTAESGGYCTGGNQDNLKALVKNGVEYATDCGMYVIIDWHILSDGNPNTYLEEAKAFFQEMAKTYADHTNVLYEICNEPNGGTSWSDIKSYAEQVIEVIREEDPDSVILVGTPNWSQYVEQAAADPITEYDNIMYTLHFYAATHKADLRDSMVRAIEAGLPVFVSEFGICDASGSGAIDTYQADKWLELLDTYNISYMAWNLSNKAETSAILKSSCRKVNGFAQEDLSDSGSWLYEKMTGERTAAAPENSQPSEKETSGIKNSENKTSEDKTAENKASGNETPGSETTQNDLEIALEIVNSWTQDDGTYFQCSVKITNLTKEARNDWAIQLTFNCDISLQNGWNGIYEAEGNTLAISSMDYNGAIDIDGSVENIGFILRGAKDSLYLIN